MPNPQSRNLSAIVHSRSDLPRPRGIEVGRGRMLTVYLAGQSDFDAWQAALVRCGDPGTFGGWHHCAGVLRSGDDEVSVTVLVRSNDQEVRSNE